MRVLPQNQSSLGIRIHGQGIPCRVRAADDLLREHRFDMRLNISLQRAGAVNRVVTAVDDGVLRGVGHNQIQLLVSQTLTQVCLLQI